MAKGEKYIKLTEYLKNSNAEIVKLSFDELERIMNVKIPLSVFKYQTFGSNYNHSFSYGWSLAGYTAEADFTIGKVTFVKEDTKAAENKNIHNSKKKYVVSSEIKVLDFYNKIKFDKHDRYRSWEHCYNFFTANRKKNIPISYFSLHLFTYLASWGMLRGSSFLLQKDYLFHNEVVEELLKDKYDPLVGINPENMDDKLIFLLFELKENINKIYYDKTYYIKGLPNSNTYSSNTLVTKILLGTLGCVPAYDRYFVIGMKNSALPNRQFNSKSIKTLKKFYLDNKIKFDEIQNHINSISKMDYPIMKLVDMHLWQTGYEYNSISRDNDMEVGK